MTKFLSILLTCLYAQVSFAQNWQYTITLAPGKVHVSLQLKSPPDTLTLKMPTWTPGYYQHMQFPEKVSHFKAYTATGDTLPWQHTGNNAWVVSKAARIEYDVKADVDFVAAAYADSTRACLNLTGICMYADIKQPVSLKVITPAGWSVATGMDRQGDHFQAPDFDILYDSPLLCGRLDSLPPFKVCGIPHYFVGLGFSEKLDRTAFTQDLKKIVTAASDIIGDIPYTHYTFLAIGSGNGGIEHLNSTTVNYTGEHKNYNFLAHEYFHHYNVKRIRPIELGPFDYDNGSRTKMLWVAEGLTVYYEYLVVRRAGLSTSAEVLSSFRKNLMAYETRTGKLHQSLAQSSLETWEEGPFGGNGISYYEKGPVIGLLFDLRIRHATNNKKSLDDVMRALYTTYYQQLHRGYSEQEFRALTESIAGQKLDELFDYVNTTKEVDYNKYLNYAGLQLEKDTYMFKRVDHPNSMQEKIYNSIF